MIAKRWGRTGTQHLAPKNLTPVCSARLVSIKTSLHTSSSGPPAVQLSKNFSSVLIRKVEPRDMEPKRLMQQMASKGVCGRFL